MIKYFILDQEARELRQVSNTRWSSWYEASFDIPGNLRHIALTVVGHVRISTVCGGICVPDADIQPIELKIFGGLNDQYACGYNNVAEAQVAHDRAVAAVQEGRLIT